MYDLRSATHSDLLKTASWIEDAEDARLWSGSRVSFPVQLSSLARDLEFEVADSWCLEIRGEVAAFGQIVPKANGRRHLARLIVDPGRRGGGLGRILAKALVESARQSTQTSVSLNVDPGNAAALALYTSLGFRESDRPPDEPPSRSFYMEHAAT
jgi:ribosomal protein S18 acetylase RimI-like enzyme